MTFQNRANARRSSSRLTLGVSTFALAAGLAAAGIAPAAAQSSSSGIETVTVTAQYTQQNLQSTPLSISAVTAQDIQARGITNITQLSGVVPNLVLTQAPAAFGNITQASIRGIGQGDFNFASEPGVGMYVDDVYYGTMPGTVFDLLDLNRVEVIRGPSGTLFGKNSVGGAVRLFSEKPTGDGSGHLEVTYGSYNELDVRGGVDLTLIPDKLFMRVAAVSKQQDGYQTLIDYACANPATAGSLPVQANSPGCVLGHFGGTNVRGGRAQLRAVISPRLEVNVAADITYDDSPLQADSLLAVDNGDGSGIHYWTPNGIKIAPYSAVPGANSGLAAGQNAAYNVPTFGIPWDSRFIPSNPYKTTYGTYQSANGVTYGQGRRLHAWGVSGTIDYDLTDNIHFKSITGYRKYDGALANDPDQSPLSIELAVSTLGNHQLTEEARLNGTALDNKLEWTVGGFYYDATSTLQGPIILDIFNYLAGGFCIPGFLGPGTTNCSLVFQQNDTITANSWSGYMQGIYHITDKLEVVAGYRYSNDEKSYFFNHIGAVAGYPGSGFFRATVDPACALVVSASCPVNAALLPSTSTTTHNDYRAVVNYHFDDDKMAYFQFSTGYRAGGINPRPFAPAQLTTYGPEQADAYEVGAKTDWWDHRLRANAALFYTQYNNRIVNQQILDNNGIPFTGPINIGSAVYKGVELELTANPVDNLLVNVNYSYLDMTLDPQVGSPAGFIDPAGTIPVGSISTGVPQTMWSASAQYQFDLGGNGSLTPRLDYRWQSVVYSDNANTAIQSNPAYGILNGRITWEAPQGGWSLALEGTNLADEKYFINKFPLLNFGLGTLEGQPAPGQQWAITLRKTF